jgi:hypothetical protein
VVCKSIFIFSSHRLFHSVSISTSQPVARHLRTILSLIIINLEVHELLSDFSLIGRDLLSGSASIASDSLFPDKDALTRVGNTAPRDPFIIEGGCKAGPGERRVRFLGLNTMATEHQRDEFKKGATVKSRDGNMMNREEAYAESVTQKERMIENGKEAIVK